ncbi:SRPBCC family protein [Dermacoccaceae bacterium W4C1]
MSANQELRTEAYIEAAPSLVWDLLTDFDRLAEWSPETLKMVALKGGGLHPGQWYLGINRRGKAVWPTRSVLVEATAPQRLVWDTRSSGARWVWELTPEGSGTRVRHSRPMSATPPVTAKIFARLFLGGLDHHGHELEADMATTLAGLKAAAEA